MVRAALIRACALVLALGCACPLHADYRDDEQKRHQARADEAVWQALFGQRVVHEAKKQLGQPYVWGAKGDGVGFDCSGLTAFVYGTLGVPIAANAMGQYAQGTAIERGNLLPGDLVFFSGVGSPLHVGIYAGHGQFYHAPGSGKLVQIGNLNKASFQRRYLGARRLTPQRPTKTPTPKKEKAP